ncbi:MAG TPA: hypothetical protein VJZ27_12115, partial [Aggregatilineales bacterium]|nr:hypothetical protein [Aggregatilineales bacterium]
LISDKVPLTLRAELPEGEDWIFTAELDTDDVTVGDIADAFTGSGTLELPDDIRSLQVTTLMMQMKTGASKTFIFEGGLIWQKSFDGITLIVEGGVYLEADQNAFSGKISGSVALEGDSAFLQNLDISAVYSFDVKQLQLNINWNGFPTLTATVDKSEFSISIGSASFGTILTSMIRMVDPSVESFQFDSPWDEILNISLPPLSLNFNFETREISIKASISESFFGGVLNINSIGLRYKKKTRHKSAQPGKKQKRKKEYGVRIEIGGSFLGQTFDRNNNPLAWDAEDESPPDVPGKGNAIFDVEYLGIGQRITFASPDEFTSVPAIMNGLIDAIINDEMESLADGEAVALLKFSRDAGWLLGAKFTLIDTVEINLIFNDPVLYGMLIALSGEKAGKLAGLRFEILYRKISDTIGVYHSEL